MSEEKTYKVALKEEIQKTLEDLRELETDDIGRAEVIEVAKLGALCLLNDRLSNLDQTLVEAAVNFEDAAVNIDNYIAERIETDKVLIGILQDIQARAIVVELSQPHFDQEKQIAALQEKINQFAGDH